MLAYRKLATLAALAALATPAAPAAAQSADNRPTVFISYFTNGAIGKNNADLQPLSKGIADMLITEMAANPGIRVVERTQLEELFREQNLSAGERVSDATAVAMGKTLGAHHMITGVYMTDPKNNLRLALRVVNVETSKVEYATQLQRSTDDVLDLISQVAAKTNKEMKLDTIKPIDRGRDAKDGASANANADLTVRKDATAQVAEAPKARKVPFEAVLLYSKGLAEADKGNRSQAVELYRRALDKFPDYAAPKKELDRLEKAGD